MNILPQLLIGGPVESMPMTPVNNPIPSGVAGYIERGIWNRLECRPRTTELSKVLNAEINDPLFMLSRQWQFGEFNMDDTGSCVFAKVELQTTELSRYKSKDGSVIPYNGNSIPLEIMVERQDIQLSYNEKLVIGNYLLKLINQNLTQTNYLLYRDKLIQEFTFKLPEISNPTNSSYSDDIAVLNKLTVLSNVELVNFINATKGRKKSIVGTLINGLVTYIGSNFDTSVANLTSFLNYYNFPTDQRSEFISCIQVFILWYKKLYSLPSNSDNSWDSNKLEYSFKVSTPEYDVNNTKSSKNAILKSEEYYQGSLDWYNFVRVEEGVSPLNQTSEISAYTNESLTTKSLTVLPSLSKFPGMPANRYWEFEDGSVNFGKIDANTADVAKMLLVEFALVYQDDWCLIPYDVPVGSSSYINGIVATDVFGFKTFIDHAAAKNDDWDDWNMYNLTSENNDPGRYPKDRRIFIPPTLTHTLESKILEKIVFIRDEMSNLVWAIEKEIFDSLGGSIDGYKVHNNITEYLKSLRPTQSNNNSTEEYELTYKLGNEISGNWIPFIPVYLDGENRSNILQRASMPLILDNYETIPIRPKTSFLRHGIKNDDTLGSNPRYFIFEEEITRSGIILQSTLQRARWFNGKTFLWKGNKKINGIGRGNSGLEFDKIID